LREMLGWISLELDSLVQWLRRLIGPFDTQFSAVVKVDDVVASCLRSVWGCLCRDYWFDQWKMLFYFQGKLYFWDYVGWYELCVKLANISDYVHRVLDIQTVIVQVSPTEALSLLENEYKITKWCINSEFLLDEQGYVGLQEAKTQHPQSSEESRWSKDECFSHQNCGNSSRGFVDIPRKSPLRGVRFTNRLACQGHAPQSRLLSSLASWVRRTWLEHLGSNPPCTWVGTCFATRWVVKLLAQGSYLALQFL
jgi:hypothetical protein